MLVMGNARCGNTIHSEHGQNFYLIPGVQFFKLFACPDTSSKSRFMCEKVATAMLPPLLPGFNHFLFTDQEIKAIRGHLLDWKPNRIYDYIIQLT